MRLFLIKPVIVLLTFAFIASCEKATNSAESYPISNIDFAFFQASNKLYVSAQALKGYQGTSLDSILVLWNGTSATNTADTIRLLDDGTVGRYDIKRWYF